QAGDPQPGRIVRRERVRGPGARRPECAEHRKVVGAQRARHEHRQALQHAPFDAGEQERHFAPRVGHVYHPSVFTTARTDSKGLSSISFASAGSVIVCSVSGPLTKTRISASPCSNVMRSGTYMANVEGTSVCLIRRCAVNFPPSAGSTFHANV